MRPKRRSHEEAGNPEKDLQNARVKVVVGSYSLAPDSFGTTMRLSDSDVSIDLDGREQPSALGKIKTLLKASAIGVGITLSPIASNLVYEKKDDNQSRLDIFDRALLSIPEVEATEIHVPARIHYLISLAGEWKSAYNAQFEAKIKSYLQNGKSIEEAAKLAEEEMEKQLNSKYSEKKVSWDIVILDTKRKGNSYEVTIDPKITDLKYKETPYPVGSQDYPEGGLEYLIYHTYGLKGGKIEGETCYDICYDSCYTPPSTEPPGCYDVCYTPPDEAITPPEDREGCYSSCYDVCYAVCYTTSEEPPPSETYQGRWNVVGHHQPGIGYFVYRDTSGVVQVIETFGLPQFSIDQIKSVYPRADVITHPEPASDTSPRSCYTDTGLPNPSSPGLPGCVTVGCYDICYDSCYAVCYDNCYSACYDSCYDSCHSACYDICYDSCYSVCYDSCYGVCYDSCYGVCYDSCYGACYDSCYDSCYGACYDSCYDSCYGACYGVY